MGLTVDDYGIRTGMERGRKKTEHFLEVGNETGGS